MVNVTAKTTETNQQQQSPEHHHHNKQNSCSTTQACCGYKGPVQIHRPNELVLFRDYWPQTKLIIGLRHPVWWFQSIYNYRIQTEPDSIVNQIPPMHEFANISNIQNGTNGGCIRGICLQRANMHMFLALMGKTSQ